MELFRTFLDACGMIIMDGHIYGLANNNRRLRKKFVHLDVLTDLCNLYFHCFSWTKTKMLDHKHVTYMWNNRAIYEYFETSVLSIYFNNSILLQSYFIQDETIINNLPFIQFINQQYYGSGYTK